MSPEMERRMMRHMQEKPRHKHGVHRYTLEQFGLSRAAETARFRTYCERFGIAVRSER